ncbi:DASH family cryptochrome [Desertifilum sp. FACHB-1129]|uniref:Cryptochrome DASH n=2 Tax=Desertifilum tharense IPPAS B-1220 TaxID=1781255 RepID=A0A1E5QLI6_9CYAN|nr:DASH family cryptochrome [Desertifilum tharense]MBD2310815.1 DASH family cryptochrome [Desertifilum sp. FACHB-1129]MBD2320852.1 DASH family cryptochrome [Desertifilum sp. FACHB-866]MBD2330980.1 DASH family cryptochrome [Desertifilum sp. FACHB-868]MDA0209694.1 DASH family cryptochrome [Cyanobacteria bacterium FC1]OEJ75223.1 cryptochrome DASH [Desertifilum tharense IPPAS B-1220]
MTSPRILIWYRNDLRVRDHQPLHHAIQANPETLIPVYCFDPRQWGETAYGFPKTGAFRGQFLLESLADLRVSLQRLGSNLVLRTGKPETILPQIAQEFGISHIYYYQEVTSEERAVETSLEAALQPLGITLKPFWGHTLYHPEDLPFEVSQLPELFTHFRKAVEKSATLRPTYPTPQSLPPLPPLDAGLLPQLADFGLNAPEPDPRAAIRFQGGETEGQNRLQHYFWKQDFLKAYKETRNGMLGADYSSKFSPWLALGCLSPRYIYEQVKAYEAQRLANDSTYWLVFELLWRDYFRLICAKHGDRIFRSSGLQGIEIPWKEDWKRFNLWREGKTGFPLVDANMRELAATGFMSNRGRQNVASFLTKNLGINWQMGAEWFESLLIDYDVCSNYGNWNYTAGVGNDARGFRFFNILKQSKDYDPQGDYVKHWLPELANLPASKVHEPWKLLPVEQQRFNLRLGVDYPHPVVDLFKSAADNERLYNAAISDRPSSNRKK